MREARQKAKQQRRNRRRRAKRRGGEHMHQQATTWEPVDTFDGEDLRPLLAAAQRTEWESAAELFIPLDGTPITQEELLRRAARRFSLATLHLRERLATVALRLAREGLPTSTKREAIPAACERRAGRTQPLSRR